MGFVIWSFKGFPKAQMSKKHGWWCVFRPENNAEAVAHEAVDEEVDAGIEGD